MVSIYGAFRRCVLLILLEAFYQSGDSTFSFERFFKAVQGLLGFLQHNPKMRENLGLTDREDVSSHLRGLVADDLIQLVDVGTDSEIYLPHEKWRGMASNKHHMEVRMSDESRANFFNLSKKAILYSKNLLPHERGTDQ